MLAKFLIDNKAVILALTREKTRLVAAPNTSWDIMDRGSENFYTHLIEVLKRAPRLRPLSPEKALLTITSEQGRELSRLGYTVSQVVHGYGAICQAITEIAQKQGAEIEPAEFNLFNYSLDVAIAEAVTGFEEVRLEASRGHETQRLGFLAHELRNALSSAVVAHELIKKGVVGRAGLTNALMEQSLSRMQSLIDRALTEVRLQGQSPAERRPLRLIEIVSEVEATAGMQGLDKNVSLTVEVDPKLSVNADRHHLVSAVANLVQNAIKFSKPGTAVTIRSREEGDSVFLDVEDRCGGLPAGNTEDFFKSFNQKGSDRTGLGLGLAISRRAVAANDGELSVRDMPGRGCVFSIKLQKLGPQTPALKPATDRAAEGSASRRRPR